MTALEAREAEEIAAELDAMSEQITRYSNSRGDLLCSLAADLIRRQAAVIAAQPDAPDTSCNRGNRCPWSSGDPSICKHCGLVASGSGQ